MKSIPTTNDLSTKVLITTIYDAVTSSTGCKDGKNRTKPSTTVDDATTSYAESTSDLITTEPTTSDLSTTVLTTTVDDATTSSTESTSDLITTEPFTGNHSTTLLATTVDDTATSCRFC